MASIKNFFDWCKRHLVLVTLLAAVFIVVFGFINIQILHMTSEPEFCAMCHPAQGTGPLAEVDSWEHSGHAEAGVSCLDCHGRPGVVGYVKAKLGGLKDAYMQVAISHEEKMEILSNPPEDLVPMEHCLFCHSDEGNEEYRKKVVGPMKVVHMRQLDDVVNPDYRLRKGLPDIMTDTEVGGTHFDHAFHMDAFELTCRDCHFGVVHDPATKTDRMNFCVMCHAENEGSAAPQIGDCYVCHQVQFEMNEGEGISGIDGEPSLMYGAGIGCQDCHTGVERGIYRPTSETCVMCHEQDYIDIFEDWKTKTRKEIQRIEEMRRAAEEALQKAEEVHRETSKQWQLYRTSLARLQFVEDDGTKGVHNRFYADEILQEAEKGFRQVLKELKQSW